MCNCMVSLKSRFTVGWILFILGLMVVEKQNAKNVNYGKHLNENVVQNLLMVIKNCLLMKIEKIIMATCLLRDTFFNVRTGVARSF